MHFVLLAAVRLHVREGLSETECQRLARERHRAPALPVVLAQRIVAQGDFLRVEAVPERCAIFGSHLRNCWSVAHSGSPIRLLREGTVRLPTSIPKTRAVPHHLSRSWSDV